MRILLSSNHTYPAFSNKVSNAGKHTGSAQHVHDLLARGLAELGHEVLYLLPAVCEPMPAGVKHVEVLPDDVDIYHTMAYRDEAHVQVMLERGVPWVNSCHLDMEARGWQRPPVTPNWIYVSENLARRFGSDRYVHNGLNPDDFIFDHQPDDYLLFISALEFAMEKGLETALWAAERNGMELVVAGSSRDRQNIEEIKELCRRRKARYVGGIYGRHKAELLARARALLCPSQLNEACPLVIIEALLSGTPVITSNRGACPELLAPGTGFACSTPEEVSDALTRLEETNPYTCRAHALEHFHYHRMARNYLEEYDREINNPVFPAPPEPFRIRRLNP